MTQADLKMVIAMLGLVKNNAESRKEEATVREIEEIIDALKEKQNEK